MVRFLYFTKPKMALIIPNSKTPKGCSSYVQYAIPRRGGEPYIWDWADNAETLRPMLRYLDMFDHDTKGGFMRYPDNRIEHPDGRIENSC
jgi:hypothetical protein